MGLSLSLSRVSLFLFFKFRFFSFDFSSQVKSRAEEVTCRGYEGQSLLVDSHAFGLPAHRRRLYFFLVRVAANPLLEFSDRPLHNLFHTFRTLLQACGLRAAPCATQVLLDNDAEAVKAELETREKRVAEQQTPKAKAGPQSSQSSAASPVQGSQWVEQHMAYAAAAKLRWGQQPPEQLRSNRWYKTLTKREQDLLPLVQAVMPDCLFRDVSQNVSRVNVTTLTMDKATERMIHVAPTLLPKQLLWMDEAVAGRDKGGRLVLGREAMLLQGFPINPFLAKLEDVLPQMAWFPSEALMFDLAGNAMSLPVILAVLQAGFASLTWKASVMMADETPVALDEDLNCES